MFGSGTRIVCKVTVVAQGGCVGGSLRQTAGPADNKSEEVDKDGTTVAGIGMADTQRKDKKGGR